jgi:molecular chaperone Hsp33
LLGAGSLVLTLDLGGNTTPFQGIVALEGDTLAECAENYFRVSEQTDTGIRLAVGEIIRRRARILARGRHADAAPRQR